MILAYFDKVSDAANAVNVILQNKLRPATLDILDQKTLQTIEQFYPAGLLTDKAAALFIEVDGYLDSLNYQQNKVVNLCKARELPRFSFQKRKRKPKGFGLQDDLLSEPVRKLKPNVWRKMLWFRGKKLPNWSMAYREFVIKMNYWCASWGISATETSTRTSRWI